MENTNVGKWIIIIGLLIVVIGLVVFFMGKFGIPIGKLPGDINIKKETYSFHFPIVTSIIVSIIFTVVVNLVLWLFRKP